MDSSSIAALRDNFSVAESHNGHLLRCWIHQSCNGCLASDECSWCPFTWSCVPNSHRIPFLAPAYDDQICPASSEQWELRTQTFGCSVSSITALTALVSIVSTLVFMLLLFLTVLAVLRMRRYAREKQRWRPTWVHHYWGPSFDQQNGRERDPLLPRGQDGH